MPFTADVPVADSSVADQRTIPVELYFVRNAFWYNCVSEYVFEVKVPSELYDT